LALSLLSGLGLAAAWFAPTPAAPAAVPAETAPVRAVLDAQVAAWNRGDLDTFLETYWKSPDLVFQSNASVARGFEATRERYRKRYQSEGKEMGQLQFEEIEVELLAPDLALARGGFRLAFRDGKGARGRFTLLLRERPEGWRIVYDHSSGE
jgi:beta-aspartyl-peptidase (threonine type)